MAFDTTLAPTVQASTPDAQPDTAAIRAAFEVDYFGDAPARARERSGDGYKYMAASVAWGTWQRAWGAALAAKPAHRPTDDELWDQTLRERDHAEKMADRLAEAIGQNFGADVGEHSSAHCPWQEALEVIGGAA